MRLSPLLSRLPRGSLPPPPLARVFARVRCPAAARGASASASVVEEAVASRALRVAPGETLVYESGTSSLKPVLLACSAAAFMDAYMIAATYLALYEPALSTLGAVGGPLFVLFAGFSGFSTFAAAGVVRSVVRVAALSRDGTSLRLTSFAAAWGVLGARPVEVPCQCFSLHERAQAGHTTTLHVALSGMHLVFDKPEALRPWLGGPGTGLVMGPRGLLGTVPDARAAAEHGTGAMLSTAQLYALPPDARAALRRYALLVHCLSGAPADAAAVRADAWGLEDMTAQLGPRARGAAEARVAELRYWRRARDAASGAEFWWHRVNSQVQWAPPIVDGKTPDNVAVAEAVEGEGEGGGARVAT